MLLKATQVKWDEWTKRGFSNKCGTVREVFVSKRAVLLGEHAEKHKSVKSFEAHSPMMSLRAFSVLRRVLNGAESKAVNLTRGVV